MSGDAPDGARRHYRIFGLTIASDMPLPEATEVSGSSAQTDVHLVLGAVPSALDGGKVLAPWIEIGGPTICLLRFEALGNFLVTGGDRIVVEKAPSATWGDLRGFLFGSAFGAIAHQRGLIPLHVSALVRPSGAIAFTGESGAGKSTMAALLNQELGWPIICDDVAMLAQDGEGFHLESGVNIVKLWQDALNALNRSSDGLRRDLTRYDKFHAIESERFQVGRFAFARLVKLDWGETLRLERAGGREAYQIVLSAVYRPEFAQLFGNRERIAATGMALASVIDVVKLTRPRDLEPSRASQAAAEIAQILSDNR